MSNVKKEYAMTDAESAYFVYKWKAKILKLIAQVIIKEIVQLYQQLPIKREKEDILEFQDYLILYTVFQILNQIQFLVNKKQLLTILLVI